MFCFSSFLELITGESNRTESDIDISSNDSHCLGDIDVGLSPGKSTGSNFTYSNNLWQSVMSQSTINSFNYSNMTHDNNNQQDQEQEQQQESMIVLKSVCSEPLSPDLTLIDDNETNKSVTSIQRRPVFSTRANAQISCTQCREMFDNIVVAQERVNSGMCSVDASVSIVFFLNRMF